MVRVSSLEKVYETAERDAVRALAGIDFQVEEGEFYVLLGPSGCGKSTTLWCIAGFEEPTGGMIQIGDPLPGYRGKHQDGHLERLQAYRSAGWSR